MKADPRVQEAQDFLKLVSSSEAKQRAREAEDLAFQTEEGAWPDYAKLAKGAITVNGENIPAEPMLAVATLDEPLRLAYAQFTSSHLGVNVHPLNDEASDDTAQILQGLYRSIEVGSRANIARGWAYDRALKAGRGAYRVHKEYDLTTGVPGDQKIVIKRIPQQSSVYFDPFAQEPDWSDGERALQVQVMPWATYKRKYKKTKLANFDDSNFDALIKELPKDWIGGTTEADRTITVADFWTVEHDEDIITIPGAGVDGTDKDVSIDKRRVQCCRVNGIEVLEEYEWDGQYIPLIPTIGTELQPYDGERRWIGMIHNAKDGARLTNLAASQAVKMALLEPEAPWQMEEGQDEGYKDEYKFSNRRKFPVLHYRRRGLSGEVAGPPTRVQVDVSRLGPSMQLLTMGKQFVETATATFGPARGEQTPAHRSGKAIGELQDQTAAATSGPLDNLAQISMTYEAMVILDLIPHVYDRPGRIAKILDEQDRPTRVMLNAPFQMQNDRPQAMPYGTEQEQQATNAQVADPSHPAKHYDLNKGRYGVTVTIGKSYKSKLEQGNDQLGQLIQAEPSWLPVIGPRWVKFLDIPGAKELADDLLKIRDVQFPMLAAANNPATMVPQLQQQLKIATEAAQHFQKLVETKQIEQMGKFKTTALQESAETQRADKDREAKIAVAIISALSKQQSEAIQIFYEERARLGEDIASQRLEARKQQSDAAIAMISHLSESAQSAQDHEQVTAQADQAHGHALQQGQQAAELAPPTTNGSGAQ